MPPGHPQREAMWLAEVFGGPAWYSQRFGGAAGLGLGTRWTESGFQP